MDILLYIGIFLFAVGVWQMSMRGAHSKEISSISLTLGIILVFIGNLHAGLFFIFLFASWFLLVRIFHFSTYHLYFSKAVIFLIAYATLAAFLLQKLGFADSVLWYLLLTSGFLAINNGKQRQAKQVLDSISEDEQDKRDEMEKSFNKTIKYHLLSSVVYILTFVFAFLYFSGSLL